MLNRRQFLATTGSAIVVASVPLKLAALVIQEDMIFKHGNFIFNQTKKTIEYVGTDVIRVNDLSRAISNAFDQEELMMEPQATVRITPQYIEIVDGWKINDDSMNKVYDGSVKNGDDHWQGITVLGHAEDSQFHIYRDGSEAGIGPTEAVHSDVKTNVEYFSIKCRGDEKEFKLINRSHHELYGSYREFKAEPCYHGSLYMAK
jgi:hypothetical protein